MCGHGGGGGAVLQGRGHMELGAGHMSGCGEMLGAYWVTVGGIERTSTGEEEVEEVEAAGGGVCVDGR